MTQEPIDYIDRTSGRRCREKVFGDKAVRLLYGQSRASSWVGKPLRFLASCFDIFSRLMGLYQNSSITKSHIEPFIKAYGIDATEFEKSPSQFTSFGDFFCRKLKPEARPIAPGKSLAVIPTDGRFYFYEDVSKIGPFDIKGRHFDLCKLLASDALANQYAHASMMLGRLCPSDYHRFHFPVDCIPSESRLINGYLYSVNPMAVRQNVGIFSENKRILTTLHSEVFGDVLCLEIGATSVGTIQQTYEAGKPYTKGAEKGFFAFGGSAMVLLFPDRSIQFDADLLAATKQNIEIRCLLGQSMGTFPLVSRSRQINKTAQRTAAD